MSKKPESILDYLKKTLEKTGETVENIEALSLGEVDKISDSKMFRQKDDIRRELEKLYDVEYASPVIPDFFAWTEKYVYILHQYFQSSGDGNSDNYIIEVGAVPRNIVETYPSYLLE